MSQLQKLLDEKWPLSTADSVKDKNTMILYRNLFTEGYNAAIEAAKNAIPSEDAGGREGCYYNDTKYDSPSAVYGYNVAIKQISNSLLSL